MRAGCGPLVGRPLLDEATAALDHLLLAPRFYFEADRVDDQIIELGVSDVLHQRLIEVRQDSCTEAPRTLRPGKYASASSTVALELLLVDEVGEVADLASSRACSG